MKEIEKTPCFQCGELIDTERDSWHETANHEVICQDCMETYYFDCADCGVIDHRDNACTNADGDCICEGCAENYCTCENCGEVTHNDRVQEVHQRRNRTEYLCENCLAEYYCCDRCHEYFERDLVYLDDNTTVCQDCYDQLDYRTCEDCGALLRERQQYFCEGCDTCVCEYCYDENHRDHGNEDEGGDWHGRGCALYSCSYKPNPIFHCLKCECHEENNYMGIELETDKYPAGEVNGCSTDLKALSDNERLFYLKEDGSLSNGIEIVTHPCTLSFHLSQFPWEAVLQTVSRHHGQSHNSGNCGLHVHFSKQFYGRGFRRSVNVLKLMYLFEKHWDSLLNFSRRENHMLSWCHKTEKPDIKQPGKNYNDQMRKGKYQAINVTNTATIEVRLWRGTLNKTSLQAALLLTDGIVRYARDTGASKLFNISWERLIQGIIEKLQENPLTDITPLTAYLERKGLYTASDNAEVRICA